MDFSRLIADETKLIGVHYTSTGGRTIRRIVLHHNAGNLSIQDCYNTWQTREASAHYQVDAHGRIGQLVLDKDIAWHAGNANNDSIGIEHANNRFGDNSGRGWTISEETLDAGAHLVAALCQFYGLGAPKWGVNVFPHKHFMGTACPGEIAMSQRGDYMLRAQFYYNNMGASGVGNEEEELSNLSGEIGEILVKVKELHSILGSQTIPRVNELAGAVHDADAITKIKDIHHVLGAHTNPAAEAARDEIRQANARIDRLERAIAAASPAAAAIIATEGDPQ